MYTLRKIPYGPHGRLHSRVPGREQNFGPWPTLKDACHAARLMADRSSLAFERDLSSAKDLWCAKEYNGPGRTLTCVWTITKTTNQETNVKTNTEKNVDLRSPTQVTYVSSAPADPTVQVSDLAIGVVVEFTEPQASMPRLGMRTMSGFVILTGPFVGATRRETETIIVHRVATALEIIPTF